MQTSTCCSDSLCIHQGETKLQHFIQWTWWWFLQHMPLNLVVNKIWFCFTICAIQFVNHNWVIQIQMQHSFCILWQWCNFQQEFNKTNSTYFSRVYKSADWKSYKVFLKDRWEKWKQFKSFSHFVFIHHHMITKQQILLLFFITVL